MSLTLDINCGVLCRCCRKTSEETDQMIFLFNNFHQHANDQKTNEFHTIYDLFTKYTQLEIDESDQNTSYICTECYKMLLNFHDFRKTCVASHLEFLKQKHLLNEVSDNQMTTSKNTPQLNKPYIEDFMKQIPVENILCGPSDAVSASMIGPCVEDSGANEDESDDCDSDSDVEMGTTPKVEFYSSASEDESSADDSTSNQQSESKNLLCENCGKSFTEESGYEKHLLTHISTLTLYSCTQCEKEYTTRGNLKMHMDSKHPADENALNRLKCHICSKVLRAEQNLRQHLLRHEGRRDFVCSFCGAKRTTKAELKRHVNRHTKEKEFPCTICSRVFYGDNDLSRHKKMHLGLKDHKCNFDSKISIP